MASAFDEVGRITDDELVWRVERLVGADRALTIKLLVHLGELNERRLYLARGYSSMYAYCQSALGMSDSEAYPRIQAAKLCRQLPLVLERLRLGEIHLTAIKMLGPYLTEANHSQLLDRVKGMSKKQIELVIAEIAPKADVPESVRRLPQPRASTSTAPLDFSTASQPSSSTIAESTSSADALTPPSPAPPMFSLQPPKARGSTTPLSPGRFKLQLTLGQEAHDVLEQLQELLRHQNPSGDLTSIVVRALTELHERVMKRRFGQTNALKRGVAHESTRSRSGGTNSRGRDAFTQNNAASDASELNAEPAVELSDTASASADSEAVGAAGQVDAAAAAGPEVKHRSRKSRYIPREVLREVYARDEGRCTFKSPDGRRCDARGFLELHHHELTFARGGGATPINLRLACRAHNLFLAEQDYGRALMQRKLNEAAAQKSQRAFQT